MRHPILLIGASSIWMASVANVPLWSEMQRLALLDSVGGVAFALALALMVGAGLTALLSLLAWRWLLKPSIAFLLLASAVGAYFMLSYYIVIDATMMVNVLQTDWRESSALFSAGLALSPGCVRRR